MICPACGTRSQKEMFCAGCGGELSIHEFDYYKLRDFINIIKFKKVHVEPVFDVLDQFDLSQFRCFLDYHDFPTIGVVIK